MTTIATDGTTVAWDGRITTHWGHVLQLDAEKVKIKDGRVFGIAGNFAIFDDVIRWYVEDEHNPSNVPPCPADEPWILLVYDAGKWAVLSSKVPYPLRVSLPYAIGGGDMMAIGFMRKGGSPLEAVKDVCECTTISGGKVKWLEVPSRGD